MPLGDKGQAHSYQPEPWVVLKETAAALQQAADHGDILAARQLLPRGVHRDTCDWTALHYAAAAGIKSLVQQLLDAGAPINCKGHDGCTPLLCAIRHDCVAVVKQLIVQGANVNAKETGWLRRRPLHEAAMQGHIAVTELLLAENASTDVVDREGDTPLHLAAQHGHAAVVELLLAKGAAINVVDMYNITPLQGAAHSGCTAAVQLLLAKGAAADAVDQTGRTPLHDAAYHGDAASVELLLARGAAVDAVDSDGRTPLHDAATYPRTASTGHVMAAQSLLAHGAAIDAADGRGRTPLHRAALNGRTELVKLLLSKGAAVHAQDHDGNTPLSFAVERIEDSIRDLDMKLDVFDVILEAGHPWPTALLVGAAKEAMWRVETNRTAFAVLAKAIFLADKAAFGQMLAELELQRGDSAAVMVHDAVQAVIEGWCSDVASLDQQRAELLAQRRDIEAQRRAVQHMIVYGACFKKRVEAGAASYKM